MKAAVMGAGFSGLAAASCLAQEGFEVTVYEKNSNAGGRARKFETQGFTFDMGPSWYWMPDVFERYFALFGKRVADYYTLARLDPSYRVYFAKRDFLDIPAGIEPLQKLFETLEPGSSSSLLEFLKEGKYKYDISMGDLVYKPGLSVSELLNKAVIKSVFGLHVFKSISAYIKKFFSHPRIIQLLEFPVLFLGAMPSKTPALYSLMNYADMVLGTWYPMGGMYKVVEGMVSLASDLGVQFKFNCPVERFAWSHNSIKGIWTGNSLTEYDYVVAGADYHHVEQTLLPEQQRRYSAEYWNTRVMAPSCLIFYVGINKKINGLLHHTLFFDEDFSIHAHEIYEDPKWPTSPQFYVSCPSKTDPSVAPPGHENLFILIPVATGLHDSPDIREKYFDLILNRLESLTGETIRQHILFKRSYAHSDFISDYNAFKGNAYGMASTWRQTANLRPSIINKNVQNLFYTGQLTVPGPGVPPALISGQVVAKELIKRHKRAKFL